VGRRLCSRTVNSDQAADSGAEQGACEGAEATRHSSRHPAPGAECLPNARVTGDVPNGYGAFFSYGRNQSCSAIESRSSLFRRNNTSSHQCFGSDARS